MSVIELKTAIQLGKFNVILTERPELLNLNHVFEEDKTENRNREKVENLNKKEMEEYEIHLKEERKMRETQYEETIKKYSDYYLKEVRKMSAKQYEAIIATYSNDSNLNEEVVRKAYSFAYAERKTSGIIPVLELLEEVLDLFHEMDSVNK